MKNELTLAHSSLVLSHTLISCQGRKNYQGRSPGTNKLLLSLVLCFLCLPSKLHTLESIRLFTAIKILSNIIELILYKKYSLI